MKKIFLWGLLACVSTAAQGQNLAEISTKVELTSQHVFRGLQRSGNALQASLLVDLHALYYGIWISEPIANGRSGPVKDPAETNLFMGWKTALSDTVTADIGAAYYNFRRPGQIGMEDTGEIYAGLQARMFETESSSSLLRAYAFYDIRQEALTLETALGYQMQLGGSLAVHLAAYFGWVTADRLFPDTATPVEENYYYTGVSVDFPFQLSDRTELSFGASYGDVAGYVPGFANLQNNLWWRMSLGIGF